MKKIALMLALCLMFTGLFGVNAFAETNEDAGIMPRLHNTASTEVAFVIDDNGLATIVVSYFGYPNITTKATINVLLEKKTLLVFWTDIYEWNVVSTEEDYCDDFTYQLSDKATYRVTVTFTIEGTGGEPDVLTSQIKNTY